MKKFTYLPLVLSIVLAFAISLSGCKKPDPGPLKKSLIITLDKDDITNTPETVINLTAQTKTFKLTIKCGYDVQWAISEPEISFITLSTKSGKGPGIATIVAQENTTNKARQNRIAIMNDYTKVPVYVTFKQEAATN